MYIDQSNISHIVTGYRWEDNHLVGTLETANTAAGKDMAGLIRQGSDVAFSMRGIGNVSEKDGQYTRIKSPLYIVAYDYVVIPSHPNSYMTRIMSESLNDYDSQVINESAEMKDLLKMGAEPNRAGKITEVDMNELLHYVKKNSENVHAMTESLEFPIDEAASVSLEENNQVLSVKKNNEDLKIFLENNIVNDANNFFKKMLY